MFEQICIIMYSNVQLNIRPTVWKREREKERETNRERERERKRNKERSKQ